MSNQETPLIVVPEQTQTKQRNISLLRCECGNEQQHVIYDYDIEAMGVICPVCKKVLALIPCPKPEDIEGGEQPKPMDDSIPIEETFMELDINRIDEYDDEE
jgi:hypothetical protein